MKSRLKLKYIVPELEKRDKKLGTVLKVLMCLFILMIPCWIAMCIMPRKGMYQMFLSASRGIMGQEKTPIVQIFGYDPLAVEAVKKLIETGNITGYHIVADVMVVKDGVEVSEAEAIAMHKQLFIPMMAARMGYDPNLLYGGAHLRRVEECEGGEQYLAEHPEDAKTF